MAILSVDLAYKRYADIGVVTMEQERSSITCELLEIPLTGVPSCMSLSEWIDRVCRRDGIRAILLDGPQGWKASNTGLVHSRRCERDLNTPAKTGEPSFVKPANYAPFVQFSISVYDALASFGWERLPGIGRTLEAQRLLIESFPLAAWGSLKIKPHLPAKSKKPNITWWADVLRDRFAVRASGSPTHDQLQAIVAGLAGLAIESNRWGDCAVAGVPPVFEGGHWREGYIVNPLQN
jgi:hypothetical protein